MHIESHSSGKKDHTDYLQSEKKLMPLIKQLSTAEKLELNSVYLGSISGLRKGRTPQALRKMELHMSL